MTRSNRSRILVVASLAIMLVLALVAFQQTAPTALAKADDAAIVSGEIPAQQPTATPTADEGELEAPIEGETVDEVGEESPLETHARATGETTLNDIVTFPAEWTGRDVEVSGEVDRVRADRRLLRISRDGDEVLVLVQNAVGPDVSRGVVVQVEGEVREFDAELVETRLGINLSDRAAQDLDALPIILANSVEVVAQSLPAFEDVPEAEEDFEGPIDLGQVDPEGPAPRAGETPMIEQELIISAPQADISNILNNPARFTGRTVTISGTVTGELPQEGVFALRGEANNERLVVFVLSPLARPLERGETLRVRGTVREFDQALNDFLLEGPTGNRLAERLTGEPVLIAYNVRAPRAPEGFRGDETLEFEPAPEDVQIEEVGEAAQETEVPPEADTDVELPTAGEEVGRTPTQSELRQMTPDQLVATLARSIGRTVVVEGDVSNVLNNQRFQITANGVNVAVFSPRPLARDVAQGETLRIRGQIFQLTAQDLQELLGVQIPQSILRQLGITDQPILVAQSVMAQAGAQGTQEAPQAEDQAQEGATFQETEPGGQAEAEANEENLQTPQEEEDRTEVPATQEGQQPPGDSG